ncbi:MAG: twin-arginine translocation signal domain-containing protein, partial [Rhizobiales bacterium]|nr:twin-arginine translocation signal domain-containing protein [Hyphomicrobiales bacterium]
MDGETVMPLHPSRRDMLKTSLGVAAATALPSFPLMEQAMAQADATPTSAAEIVQAIRDKKITAVSAVQAAIDRAEKLKDLNTLIYLNKDAALAAARDVDAGKI